MPGRPTYLNNVRDPTVFCSRCGVFGHLFPFKVVISGKYKNLNKITKI